MQLKVISKNGKSSGTVDVSDNVFAYELNESLVHQVVVSYLANARQGTRAQKNRSAVRGGGKKPWRQKGTGRARAGTIRSPIWRKGGVTFAAKPQDYSQKVNKKMYHRAMRSIFSELIRQDRLKVVENFTLESRKTRDFVSKLNELSCDLNKNKKIMLVLDNVDLNMHFASSNIPNVFVCDTTEVDPLSLVSCENVIVTPDVLKHFDEVLA